MGYQKCLLLNNKKKYYFDESDRKYTTYHVVAQSETKIVYENETRKENEKQKKNIVWKKETVLPIHESERMNGEYVKK